MTSLLRFPRGRLAIVIITILAITGTLSACGRYGRPVRVAPATDTIDLAVEDENAASADAADLIDESSEESGETRETEESDR